MLSAHRICEVPLEAPGRAKVVPLQAQRPRLRQEDLALDDRGRGATTIPDITWGRSQQRRSGTFPRPATRHVGKCWLIYLHRLEVGLLAGALPDDGPEVVGLLTIRHKHSAEADVAADRAEGEAQRRLIALADHKDGNFPPAYARAATTNKSLWDEPTSFAQRGQHVNTREGTYNLDQPTHLRGQMIWPRRCFERTNLKIEHAGRRCRFQFSTGPVNV